MRNGLLAVMLALIAAGIGVLLSLPHAHPVASATSQAARPIAQDVTSTPIPASNPAPAAADSTTWTPDDPPATVASRYARAKDKRAFYDEALRTGGGAYVHFAERAFSECLSVIDLGSVGHEQAFLRNLSIGDPGYHERLASYRERFASCRGFDGFQQPRQKMFEVYRRKGDYGDPLSQAARLVRQTTTVVAPGAYAARRSGARELLDGGDPYVLLELLPVAARGTRRHDVELEAWMLVAADLGADVSQRSMALEACAWNGRCDVKRLEDLLQAGHAHARDFEAVLERKREVAESVRRRDWVALGF